MSNLKQFCTFYVESLFLALEVERVQEIIKHQPITRVPMASPVVRGLINLRGQIVTAIDLRRRMRLPDGNVDEAMNVVMVTPDGTVSLLVDRVGDVLFLDDRDFERPPETMAGSAREFIRGAYKLENELILALEADRVVNINR